ncbi:hypothetical protein BKA56DRAFT_627376 [Ilyonectria sp. MPI-CAGE-AT-0026]|nr:hypothetical protein BKA56DRAFT_627376 [Ilyonectria sp. MPI-CAGE-AT-0026]
MIDYWRQSLADCWCPPFPTPPPYVQQPVADRILEHQFPQPRQRSTDIVAPTVIRAAWALIARWMANSEDVLFGVTVSRRTAPVAGIDKIARPTIAIVPLRVKLASEHKVSDYLKAVQQQATEIMPFEQMGLHRIAKVSLGSQKACMFQTLLVIQPYEEASSLDAIGQWQDGDQQQCFDINGLVLVVQAGTNDITAAASFDSRVMKPWAVKTLLKRLKTVTHQSYRASPKKSLADIDMLTTHDLGKLCKWNDHLPEPAERCVHQMIEDKAKSQPDAPSIYS